MPDGMLTPYTKMDALGAFGQGLLSLSQNRKINPNQLLVAPQQPQQQPMPAVAPQSFSGVNESYTLPENGVDDAVARLMRAIGHVESGNKYSIMGPRTRTGDRAYGQYQIMGANIPSWTREVLGYSMTPDEFLQNPQAQDAVARAKLGGYLNRYGNINDAASMWFSGRPFKNNIARDVLGTSVPQYVNMVSQNY